MGGRRQGPPPDRAGEPMLEPRARREVGIDRTGVALADEDPHAAALVGVVAGADAVIDPFAGIDAIEAGEAVAQEEAGLVELEALAVLVGNGGAISLPGGGGDHGDGLDHLAGTVAAAHPRIVPSEGEL